MTPGRHWSRGALAGLAGGLLAAGAMSLAHRLVGERIPQPETRQVPPEDDSTVKVASQALRLVGRSLAERHKPLAGTIVHYAFGAVVGAVYGGLGEVVPRVTAALGLPFGVAVWLGAHVITVPALGLAEPPTRQPLGKEATELGLHLVYGADNGTAVSLATGGQGIWTTGIAAPSRTIPSMELTMIAGRGALA